MSQMEILNRRLRGPAFDRKVDDAARYYEDSFTGEESARVWQLAFALIAGGQEPSIQTALPRAVKETTSLRDLFSAGGLEFDRDDLQAGIRERSNEPFRCCITWDGNGMKVRLTAMGRQLLAQKILADE